MPKDEVPSEDGMEWLASQLGDGARPALPDEYSPRQSPRWPRTSRIVPPAPVEPTNHTGVFLWGLKPTSQPDPRLAKGAAARTAAAAAAADGAAPAIPAAPVPGSPGTPAGTPSSGLSPSGLSQTTGSVPTTTAALFVLTPADPARAAAVAAASTAAPTDDSASELTPAGLRSASVSVPKVSAPEVSASDVSHRSVAPAPLPPVEAPAPLQVPGGAGPDEADASRSIRSEKADLAPAPWWTTLTQSPLELTPEESAAADVLAGRTPPAPAPEPAPLPAPVSARGGLRARLAASLSAPTSLAGPTSVAGAVEPAAHIARGTAAAPAPVPASPAPVSRAAARLAEAAEAASQAAQAADSSPVPSPVASVPVASVPVPVVALPADTPIPPVPAATSAQPADARSGAGRSPESAPAAAAPRPASGANASSGTSRPVAANGPRPASSSMPSGSGAARTATAGRPPGGSRPGTRRLLIWIAGGLVLVLALAALFFLGQSLIGGEPTPVAGATSSATPTPSATPAEATGPQPVGLHQWDTLFGGECLQPYETPWAEEFTVADCATPHTAQLVYRGLFAGDAATAFPGEADLAGQINLLCSATGVTDLAAAYDDVQVQGSYPITEEQWSDGARYYYCFVSRASGEPLTASIAGPGPAPAG